MQTSRLSPDRWPLIAVACVAAVILCLVFQKTFTFLYYNWQREEYSHGFLIPPISAYLLWRRRALLEGLPRDGAWFGFGIVVLGLLLYVLTFYITVVGADAYAMVVVVAGLALAALGWQGFKIASVPLALLLLMNPLPNFWYHNLSSELQLVSSQLGVAIMRLFDVSVFLQGNVIDLGEYKLQVAEACSGLRYLFPLMTLGALVAYLFEARAWMRWALFLSTMPITVAMNGIRVGLIGVLVDRFGIAQAEGTLHQFEGWLVFMACIALLLLEARVLMWLTGDRRPLGQAMGLRAAPAVRQTPPPKPAKGVATPTAAWRGLPLPVLAAAVVLAVAIYPAHALPQRAEVRPQRREFNQFPMHVGQWAGAPQVMEDTYLDQLKLDDYLLADFTPQGPLAAAANMAAPVNFYVAYYASQRTGQAAHSPSSCLPGSGWRMEQLGQRQLAGIRVGGQALQVNRAVIRQGSQRMVVYYWFQERGRDLTNEYLVKWYLLVDSLQIQRTDGALVRLVTPLKDGEDPAAGDARLEQFASLAVPALRGYLPDR